MGVYLARYRDEKQVRTVEADSVKHALNQAILEGKILERLTDAQTKEVVYQIGGADVLVSATFDLSVDEKPDMSIWGINPFYEQTVKKEARHRALVEDLKFFATVARKASTEALEVAISIFKNEIERRKRG